MPRHPEARYDPGPTTGAKHRVTTIQHKTDHGATPEDPHAGMQVREITLPGREGDVPAVVAECGTGRPVVFLHGLAGLNDHWEDVVRRIKHTCRCILLELPLLELKGDDCSIEGVSEITDAFLASHVPERSVLVGNSFGGHVAVRCAISRPDLVRGLVLAGASGLIESHIVQSVQLKPKREWMFERIAELFYDRSHVREADVDRAFRDLSDRRGVRAMVSLSKTARRDNLADRLHLVKAPTLLLWGREDVVTPPEAAHGFANGIAGSKLVWFDRCGHAPMVEAPEGFARETIEFLQDLDRRAV